VVEIPIKLIKLGTSAGYGALDIVAEYADETLKYTKSFQNITDWLRVGAVVGGYAGNMMEVGLEDVTESLVLSGFPLLEKSLYRAVKEYALKGMRKGRVGLRLKEGVTPPPAQGGQGQPPIRYL